MTISILAQKTHDFLAIVEHQGAIVEIFGVHLPFLFGRFLTGPGGFSGRVAAGPGSRLVGWQFLKPFERIS